MPNAADWGAFIASLQKAAADLKQNRPLAPVYPPSNAQIAAALNAAAPYLVELAAAIEAHPGAIRAIDDVLEALKARGFAWAGDLEAAINAAPGGLQEVESWLPFVASMLVTFAPAPTWEPGPGPYRGR